MNQKGDTAGNIFLLLLAAGVIIALAAIFWGLNSGSKIELGDFEKHDCEDKLLQFSSEYGFKEVKDDFFFNANDFYIIDFNSSWELPFSGKECKIIEDESLAKEIFKTSSFKETIKSIDENFFSSTRDCINVAGYKGASNICEVTGLSNRVIEFPVTKIVATIPTEATKDFAGQLVDKSWVREGAGSATEVVKKIVNTNIVVGLKFVEDSSCKLKNTVKKSIWDFSDAGNQIFSKAKNNEFYTDTIPKLAAISEYIVTLESVKVERKMPEPEAPNDIIGSIIYFIQSLWDIGTMFSATISEATIETINTMSTPDCTVEKQTAKFETFKETIISEDYLRSFDNFNVKLVKFKEDAKAAMQSEEEIKRQNGPGIFKILFLPSKSLSYFLYSSPAKQNYDSQLYLSAKSTAEESYSQYERYWETIEMEHIAISVILWGIAIILFLKFVGYPIAKKVIGRRY